MTHAVTSARPTVDAATPRRSGFRGDVQGLRAVAVGVVVLSHAGVSRFAGGFVGVDVFFVVSGFLITGILTRELRSTGRISVSGFYARRARRILPASTVVLVAVTVASGLVFGPIRLAQVLHDVVWTTFFAANIHFARTGADYFSQDSFASPVQHYWSLAVEEQFYVVWPALIAIVALVARRRVLRSVGLLLVGLSLLSFLWCLHQTATVPQVAYFSTLTRAWELGVGALLALAVTRVQRLGTGLLSVLSWIGLALIAWSCLTYTSATPFPGKAAVVPVLGSLLVLAGGTRPTPYGASLLLDRRPMRWTGDISYSLYLVHWPVLTMPAMALAHPLGTEARAVLVVVSVVLAALSYYFVETPFRSAGFWRRSRARALGLWPVAIAVVLTAVLAVGTQTAGFSGATKVELDPQQSGRHPQVDLAIKHAVARSRARQPVPAALTPSPDHLVAANWRIPSHCWADTPDRTHDICTMGDTRATRTLVLYGDSHIGMWTAPITEIAARAHWKVVLFLKTGCPAIDALMWRPERSDTFGECTAWRTWAEGKIANLKPDRIVTTGYTLNLLADPRTGQELAGDLGPAGTAVFGRGARATLADLTRITPHVTVIGDTTTLRRLPVNCFDEKLVTLRTCAGPVNELTASRNAVWKQAVDGAGAQWVDVNAWLCPRRWCPIVVGNVIVYTDKHHLTRTFARELEPLMARALGL